MQASAAFFVIFPGLPGGEKIEAQSETCLENDEAVLVLPTLRQVVAGQEDMARLRRTALRGVIDVVIDGGERRAVRRELEAGGLQFVH